MILESLITDGTRLTFDCCKATIKKGDTVEISDKFYYEREVQGAIKLGYVKLIGEEPIRPAQEVTAPEIKKRFISRGKCKIAFECIKGCVEPGKIIEIPESKTMTFEVQNAINCGLIEDLDGEYSASPTHQPVVLEEVVLTDEPTGTVRPPVAPRVAARAIPEARPAMRGRPARPAVASTTPPIQARRIGRTGSEDDAEIVDGESRLHVPPPVVPEGRPARNLRNTDNVASAMDEVLGELDKTPELGPEPTVDTKKDFSFFDVFKEL